MKKSKLLIRSWISPTLNNFPVILFKILSFNPTIFDATTGKEDALASKALKPKLSFSEGRKSGHCHGTQ